MVRENTGAPSEGATCAWMAADEAVGCTRAFLTMWRWKDQPDTTGSPIDRSLNKKNCPIHLPRYPNTPVPDAHNELGIHGVGTPVDVVAHLPAVHRRKFRLLSTFKGLKAELTLLSPDLNPGSAAWKAVRYHSATR
ncbi:hypothetical protein TNCV_5085231 [Trichonephila clavipes]|uniref:Uncharacterized protein n=1 Tax=Trichonephila clavipes TaxID=2585209 RepID=A0A8X6S4J6_TRICX|nr:hypothetical protein TNCV_5085231 [Trichonephila clavipes]